MAAGSGQGSKVLVWAPFIVSIVTAVFAGFVTLQVEQLRNKTMEIDTVTRQQQVVLDQRKFEAEQQSRKDQIIIQFVPLLASASQSEVQKAKAIFFVLYPNEAESILSQVAKSVGQTEAENLQVAVEQAQALNELVGDWTVVISNDSDLPRAEDEAKKAEALGYSADVYFDGTWYVTTVGRFPSETEALSANIQARSDLRPSAYVLNLKRLCPKPKQTSKEDITYFSCV